MAPQSSPCKILFLAANPKDTSRLRLDEEIRNIQEGLKLSADRNNFELIAQWAVRTKDLRRALLEYAPQIVHFSGHGAGDPGLILEDEMGDAQAIPAAVLARLFKLCPSVDCVLLNACYSEVQATALADHIPYVIGMNQAIGDAIAIKFAVGFYDALGYGRTYEEAYEFGMTAIGTDPIIVRRDISPYPDDSVVDLCAPTSPILMQSASLTQRPTTGSLSRKDFRNRQALLNKVKNYWIKGVLERSLHNQILIELGLEERWDFTDPFNMALGMVNQTHQSLAPGTQAIEVFDGLGEGRSLLVLGEPGAGKTITLLQLTQALMMRAQQDTDHLIPVVFNLSSWKNGQPLGDWLIEELNTKYQVPKSIGVPWVKQQELLLMFDGLDEVPADHREACVEAINQFQQAHGTEMVVCSRIKDYERLSKHLNFQGAIYLNSLTPEKIQHYLDNFGAQITGLRQLLIADSVLQELAQSPLMLNLMVLAYGGLATVNFPKTDVIENHRKRLFNIYIQRMLARRSHQTSYTNVQVIRWLNWLARSMSDQSKTVFLIERLDRSWLRTKYQRWFYVLLVSILTGMLFALIFGLGITLSYGIFAGLQIGVVAGLLCLIFFTPSACAVMMIEKMYSSPRKTILLRWAYSIVTGVTVGLSLGLTAGSLVDFQTGWMTGGGGAIASGFADYLTGGTYIQSLSNPVESLQWSWVDVRNKSIFWVTVYLVGGGLFRFFRVLGPQFSLFEIVSFCLLVGLLIGLLDGLSSSAEIETKTRPNQGIKQSAKTSLMTALVVCIVLTLMAKLLGLPIFLGVVCGLLVAVYLGGNACFLHGGLRITLCSSQCTPWNYAHFLDYAVEHGFLQKVGGGYIFIHRSLMEHFARLNPSSLLEVSNGH